MTATSTPWINPECLVRFAVHCLTRTPQPLEHRLEQHELLTLDAIASLAGELGEESVAAEQAIKPVVASTVSTLSAVATEPIASRIRGLADNESWFTLLNIEKVAPYRDLVDDILDGLARASGLPPTELRRRMGFVFASSPGSVTPAHIDIENSVLLQLSGHRRIGFGTFRSADDREREVRRYWEGSFGRLEVMPQESFEFDLTPGTGAFIPPFQPHWVINSDETSLSLTVTFFDRDNDDESTVQALNARLRRIGLAPSPYGAHRLRDLAKLGAARTVAALRGHRGDAPAARSR